MTCIYTMKSHSPIPDTTEADDDVKSDTASAKFGLATIYEDYLQVNLQYFWFEKYLMGMVMIV